MIELLEPILGAPVELEVLKDKPGRRTTSRASGSRRSAIVKVYVSARAPTVAGRIAALAGGPAELVIPELLLCDPERHLVVLSEVPGAPLSGALLAGDAPTCERAGSALGAWHRAWQGSAPEPLALHTQARELEILEARLEATDAAVAAPVRAALEATAPKEWGPVTVLHRDLYEEQIMVSDRIGLIDLDDAALGPPELDLGNLLGHVELLALRSGRDLREVTEAFLDGYRRSGPSLDRALLIRCRRLTLLRLTCIHGETAILDLL